MIHILNAIMFVQVPSRRSESVSKRTDSLVYRRLEIKVTKP